MEWSWRVGGIPKFAMNVGDVLSDNVAFYRPVEGRGKVRDQSLITRARLCCLLQVW
jgi:hypothetical protein